MDLEIVKKYAKEHTVKDCAIYFNKTYDSMQSYLARHKIKHLPRDYRGKENGRYTHGMSNTRLNNIYTNMKQRCYNSKCPNYKNYGARGIEVCSEWLLNKKAFFDWAIKNGYKEGLTIDRIDNDKGYSPENCRWVNMIVQGNNRRVNCYITYKGETKTLAKWSRIYKINYKLLQMRLYKYKWDFEKAVSYRTGKHYFFNDEYRTLKDIADIVGISYGCLESRITKLGMSLEEATKTTKDLRYKLSKNN